MLIKGTLSTEIFPEKGFDDDGSKHSAALRAMSPESRV